MTVILSLLAAISWGSGDFLGGVASRHGRTFAVAAGAQIVGLGALLIVAPLVGGNPTATDMVWGAAGGVSAGIAVLLLYRGMTITQLGVVAPIAAIGTALFPLGFAMTTGTLPSGLETAGMLAALVAIWLISREPGGRSQPTISGLLFGLGAGAGFGGLLISLSRIGDGAGIWPLTLTRVTGFLIVVALATIGRQPVVPLRRSWPVIVASGAVGAFGNVFFLFASQRSLIIAAVIGSLFPAATVMLARVFLHERLSRSRMIGIATGLVAVVLIALS